MKAIIAMTSAALLSLAANQAAAQTEPGPPKIAVSYADLDLTQAAGRAALEARVSGAVKRVCPGPDQPYNLANYQASRKCRANAWAGAKPQLAAIFDGRNFAEASVRVSGPSH
jgi:UrcA family protein